MSERVRSALPGTGTQLWFAPSRHAQDVKLHECHRSQAGQWAGTDGLEARA